jgi:hypothetical protein
MSWHDQACNACSNAQHVIAPRKRLLCTCVCMRAVCELHWQGGPARLKRVLQIAVAPAAGSVCPRVLLIAPKQSA